MTREELRDKLKVLESYASINQRYHQVMVDRWGKRDRRLKITLGFLTVIGFTVSVLPVSDLEFYGIASRSLMWCLGAAFGFASLTAAVALNIVRLDDIERGHAEAFARWTYLFQDISTARATLDLAKEPEIAFLAKRVPEFIAKRSEIEKSESKTDRKVMQRCQEDENEYRWGTGIRTEAQVRAEQSRRAQTVSQQTAVAASP